MASATASLGQYLGQPSADGPHAEEAPHHRWWLAWESWLTLALVVLVQLPVVGSLQSSNWVAEMPSLIAPAAAGLAAAWLLGHSRLPGLLAVAIGAATGVVMTTALVMQTMILADPTEGGVLVRWEEFRARIADWTYALLNQGISTDPLPFVVLLIGAMFIVGFVSTWAVVRWRNPWVALVPGGFTLLTNISYLPGQPSSAFVLFIVAAVLLVARLTFLRSADRWHRQGVAPNESMSIEVLVAGAVVGLFLVFAAWTIPTANHLGPLADTWARTMSPVNDRIDRIGQLFIGVGSKKHLPVHSFGASLPLQGEISMRPEVLFEVVSDAPGNLRGAVYDDYTGSGWRISPAGARDVVGTTVEAASLGTAASRATIREPMRVQVTVVSPDAPSAALLSVGDPVTTDADARILLDEGGNPLAISPGSAVREGSTYETVGTVSVAAISTLQESGTEYPASIYARYTALPASLPPEVAALAQQVTADARTPYDAARLIEIYLRQSYVFTLNIEATPPLRDSVAHFLFDGRRGYFDQFASAMVVMLRTQGIPARVATGFALDERDFDSATRTYRVTEERAWAWPEVFFPSLGWVEFNPTPSRGVVERPGDDSAARAAAALLGLGGLGDRELPPFIDDDGGILDDFGSEPFVPFVDQGPSDAARALVARLLGWIVVGAAAVLLLALGARLWWERHFHALSPAERRWAKLLFLARVAGLDPLRDRTAVEAAHDISGRVGHARSLRELALAYSAQRYGGTAGREESPAQGERLDQHYADVRSSLRRLILRRAVRFGRVQGGPLSRWDAPTPAGTGR